MLNLCCSASCKPPFSLAAFTRTGFCACTTYGQLAFCGCNSLLPAALKPYSFSSNRSCQFV